MHSNSSTNPETITTPTPWKFKSRNNKAHIKLVSLPQRSLKRPQIMKFLWYLPRRGHRPAHHGGVHSVSRRPGWQPSREPTYPTWGKRKIREYMLVLGRKVHYQLCVCVCLEFLPSTAFIFNRGMNVLFVFSDGHVADGRCEVSNHWRSPKSSEKKSFGTKNDMQRGKSSRHDSENIGKKRRQSVQFSVLIPPRVHYNFTA